MPSIDRFYADIIDRCLIESIDNPDKHTSICADPILGSPNNSLALCESAEKKCEHYIFTCIHCLEFVEGGIECENCKQWNHFHCESLDHINSNLTTFYDDQNIPNSCLSCRHLTIVQDVQLHSSNLQGSLCTEIRISCEDVLLEDVFNLRSEDVPDTDETTLRPSSRRTSKVDIRKRGKLMNMLTYMYYVLLNG